MWEAVDGVTTRDMWCGNICLSRSSSFRQDTVNLRKSDVEIAEIVVGSCCCSTKASCVLKIP